MDIIVIYEDSLQNRLFKNVISYVYQDHSDRISVETFIDNDSTEKTQFFLSTSGLLYVGPAKSWYSSISLNGWIE